MIYAHPSLEGSNRDGTIEPKAGVPKDSPLNCMSHHWDLNGRELDESFVQKINLEYLMAMGSVDPFGRIIVDNDSSSGSMSCLS